MPAVEPIPTPPAPLPGDRRNELIDALRGFALAGVLAINLGCFTLYDFIDDATRAALPTAAFDVVASAIVRGIFDSKAMTLFSLLFGLGFALQLQRAEARGTDGLRLYVRRIAVLMAFGALHAWLLWWGDILLVYALMGLLLITFRRLGNRTLLALGLFVALALQVLAMPWTEPWIERTTVPEPAIFAANVAGFSSPHWRAMFEQNLAFNAWATLNWWGVYPFAFGRFLLGFWAGRVGLLQDPRAHRGLLRRILLVAAPVGLAATLLDPHADALQALAARHLGAAGVAGVYAFLRAGPLGLGIAYGCAVALLFLHAPWRRWLRLLAPAGRMALSNYLVQTVACMGVFYGVGLGIGPRYGMAGWLVAWFVLYAAQVALSHWWLARFRFGPMEWLWRSLAYGRRQPFRRDPGPTPHAVDATR